MNDAQRDPQSTRAAGERLGRADPNGCDGNSDQSAGTRDYQITLVGMTIMVVFDGGRRETSL